MYLYWCIISHVFNIFVVAASAFVFLLTSKGTFLNIISLITLAFFLNAVNLIMSWYLAGIYLIAVGMSSLMGGTDIFVGFHSTHGWEVLLENGLRHFGLPENRDFIFLFIASFPVILDTVFKYWIFRYLNQVSPSAVATYRNMNE